MTRIARALLPMMGLVVVAALFAPGMAWGIERFPPPDFTDHALPETQVKPPRPAVMEYVDLGVLVLGLVLASYFALGSRSRRGLMAVAIGSIVWLGFVREGCVCPIGAIQNVTLALADPTYAIPVVAIAFFGLPILFTLFFGRTFCAAVCPLGAVQELAAVRPVRVPRWLEQALGLLPYVYLGAGVALAATGSAFLICRYDPFVGFFRLGGTVNMLIVGGCLLVIGVFIGRPYCRFLCPYGAILGLVSKVSKWHARVTPDECIHCRLCEDACPYGAIDPPTVDQPVEARPAARRRLGLLLALLPVLVIGGGMLGRQLAVPLSRLDPTVALAERVRSESLGLVEDTTDASDAFRNTGRPLADLYAAALAQRHKLALAGMAFGAWIGLVVGVKMIHLSIRRRRADYDPNPANCVSCGRCFWYCPQEQARLGLIEVEEKAESGRRKAEERYPIAARTAWVAGVFSVIVSAMLLVDYARRQVKDPLDSPEFLELKAELVKNPRDEALKEEIRAMDLSLREAYYRQRRFAHAGGHLLLFGVLVFLVAARTAATLRRKPSKPEPAAAPLDTEARTHRIARASVVALALVLVAAATALTLSSRSELPDSDEALAEMFEPAPSGASATAPADDGAATASVPAPAVAAAAPASDLPTDAEIDKYWPRFRGPGGSGVSAYTNLPTAWNGVSGEGIVWKTKVPLLGNNSPVVWGDRVFLTGATDRQREVYAFDAKDGKLLWSQPIPGTPQSTAEPPKVMEDTGYAAPTVTTDGRRVYAMFANGDVAALDFGGKIVWTRSLGLPENMYGHASSPVMYRNLVLIQFDQASVKDGKSKLLALEGTTGKTVWETPREAPNSWATPIVFRHADRDQIVAAAWPWVISYAPADGKDLWRARLLSGDHGVSPVFADGLIQIGNEYCKWFALRADGQGDVTKTHVAWKGEDGLPDLVSPLVTGEFLLLSTSTGTVTCYDAKKGGMLWEEDFETDFSSSPSLVGNRVYLFAKDGKGWIVEPTREACKRIAETDLGEPCVTSPALQDGRLYIRGQEHLFCIGK